MLAEEPEPGRTPATWDRAHGRPAHIRTRGRSARAGRLDEIRAERRRPGRLWVCERAVTKSRERQDQP
nr:hypothetical protein GCM10020063_017400 [Dactylosporangium thailandense]